MSDLEALGLGVEYVPFKVELTHPETGLPLYDENGVQAFIEIDGQNSEAGEKLTRKAALRLQQQRRAGREAPIDLDRAREENADALAQVTRSWHLVNLDGKAVPAEAFPCNAANARQLYSRKATKWMADQVGAAFRDEANFIKT